MAESQGLVHGGTSSEEQAYSLLEEARLRCARLMVEGLKAPPNPDGLGLGDLHGDLGIAGYHAGTRLEPTRRARLLAQARERSDRGDATSVRALTDVAAAATRTVERSLTAPVLLDHMYLAHVHALSACETLDAMFALPA